MNKEEISLEQFKQLCELLNKCVKRIYSFEEASEYMSVSKSFLYKETSKNSIPFYRPSGKLIYFLREDLDSWLLRNRVKSNDELVSEIESK